MANQIITMKDFVDRYYAPRDMRDVNNIKRTLMRAGAIRADDPALTTTTGVYTDYYGKFVFDWKLKQQTTWKLTPKKPWVTPGWRVLTADEATTAGIDENAALVETDKPDLANITDKPKYVNSHWEVTEPAQFMSQFDGPDGDLAAYYRKYFAKQHPAKIDAQLMGDPDTVAGYNFESLERIISSKAEEDDCLTAGDADIYGLDRSAATTYDAVVLDNDGTTRIFTLALLDSLIQQVRDNCDTFDTDNYVFIMGNDTLRVLKNKLSTKQRFDATTTVKIDTYNGVSTHQGIEGGFKVRSYDDIPIFTTTNAVTPSGGIGNILLANMNYVEFRVAMPTTLLETTPKDYITIDAMKVKYAMFTGGELTGTRFNCHGKLRDLKES